MAVMEQVFGHGQHGIEAGGLKHDADASSDARCVADNIELHVFGVDLNNRSGRIGWVLGSLAAIGLGVLLLRANKRAA